ncbi:MAG: hypothetical protein ABIH92_01115 [Nanoarchaeota archaeon]
MTSVQTSELEAREVLFQKDLSRLRELARNVIAMDFKSMEALIERMSGGDDILCLVAASVQKWNRLFGDYALEIARALESSMVERLAVNKCAEDIALVIQANRLVRWLTFFP